MAKKILLFNHKGGVSKTTSTYNIGWKLAEMGKRVLLVDADPQCNLTSFFLGTDFDRFYDEPDTQNQNIKNGVDPAFQGSPNPIKAVDCKNHSRNSNLYLLAGHMNLSELEAQLTFALTASMSLSSLQNLPGSFNELIEKTIQKYEIDYVFIDVNPGLGSINQVMFLISDGFIIPTNPDLFCKMALNSLSYILPSWAKWKNNNISNFTNAAYSFPAHLPQFIGTIIQRFNIRNGKAAGPYKDNIHEIKEITKNKLVPEIQKYNMTFDVEKYTNDYCLAEIKDFASLGQTSQQLSIPVVALTEADIPNSGVIKENLMSTLSDFQNAFINICNTIILLYE
ncbi:MAG: AAA family ATPase [Bacteroidales bacterium]|nr:AAA family ATPase [Candidatus Colimorpha pelethequi]